MSKIEKNNISLDIFVSSHTSTGVVYSQPETFIYLGK